jgi:large subunit ribosomal protein L4
MLSKAEMPGGGRKPWPQKKVGKHHAGRFFFIQFKLNYILFFSIRSPHFYRGGFAHGVRGPATKFYMLPDTIRLHGLRVALTIKHAQDDLVIVDDFNSLSTTDPQVL